MSEHYYTEKPNSPLKEKEFSCSIKGRVLTLTSVSGVFSFSDRMDKASKLLVESFAPSGSAVLDLGCGYGAIGLFIKALYPEQELVLSDINERAVIYARKNAQRNKLKVEVIKSHLFSAMPEHLFDDIVANPPIAAGKELLGRLISESYSHLNSQGSLWLVAFHNKGGSSLKKMMLEQFGNVEDVEKSGGIRVYRSRKP